MYVVCIDGRRMPLPLGWIQGGREKNRTRRIVGGREVVSWLVVVGRK